MSWLSDFATKTEALLNKVDQAAAEQLNSPRREASNGGSLGARPPAAPSGLGTPSSTAAGTSTSAAAPASSQASSSPLPAAGSSSSSSSPTAMTTSSSSSQASAGTASAAGTSPTPASAPVASTSDSSVLNADDAAVEALLSSMQTDRPAARPSKLPTLTNGRSRSPMLSASPTPSSSSSISSKLQSSTPETQEALVEENKLLRLEMTALTDEVASLATRVRSTQEALSTARSDLAAAERKLQHAHSARREAMAAEETLRETIRSRELRLKALEERLAEAEEEKKMILRDHKDAATASAQAVETLKQELQKAQATAHAEEQSLTANRSDIEAQLSKLQAEHDELKLQHSGAAQRLNLVEEESQRRRAKWESAQRDLEAVRQELADYKTRATRVLQTKEKIIADLRAAGGSGDGSGSPGADGSSPASADLIQAQNERAALEEELQDTRDLVQQLRDELLDLEQQQQQDADLAESQFKELEAALRAERKLSAEVQKEREQLARDSHNLREEMVKAHKTATEERETLTAEIAHLKSQLQRKAAGASSTSDLEARIRSLTDNLLQKQSKIESLTAERSSLQLQLETERRGNDDFRSRGFKDSAGATSGMDAWDEAMRLRPIVGGGVGNSESQGLRRQLATAANVLDAFSIRLGVFLRRYPMARIFVIVYMLLLHLWVMVVLLTYSPEMHEEEHEVLAVVAPGAMPGAPN